MVGCRGAEERPADQISFQSTKCFTTIVVKVENVLKTFLAEPFSTSLLQKKNLQYTVKLKNVSIFYLNFWKIKWQGGSVSMENALLCNF